jgi:hypothetical protein
MKDPAVLFYTQDFLIGTYLMTNEQVGKYIRLLCLQQQNGGLSEKQMLKICGTKDEDIWTKFKLCDDGFYYNTRMLLEAEKRNKYCESRRDIRQTYVKRMENSNKKIENRNKKEEEFKGEVFEFAEKYPESMLDKFCNYWTEMNPSKTKMRFELQKTFEISKRLATWANRDKEFNKIEKTESLLTYKEILYKHNQGETDVWEKYEKVNINGKNMYQRKKIIL